MQARVDVPGIGSPVNRRSGIASCTPRSHRGTGKGRWSRPAAGGSLTIYVRERASDARPPRPRRACSPTHPGVPRSRVELRCRGHVACETLPHHLKRRNSWTTQSWPELWERHTELEFATKDAAATVATMTPDNYVNHVPVMTGGRGTAEMIEFYGTHFIPKMPADTTLRLMSRTIGDDRVMDEFVFSFTHDVEMDWMLPGIAPTGRDGRDPDGASSCSSRARRSPASGSHWDQASVHGTTRPLGSAAGCRSPAPS